MSCGEIALRQIGIIPDFYYSSEIDKHAIAQTQLNFPATIQLGSVVNVNVNRLEHIDLLIGGSPCFVSGTKVICKNEIKNIEDVKTGDYVLTHNNSFKKVISIGNDIKNTISVKSQGSIDTITTYNHPYYVRSMNRKWDNENRTSYRSFSEAYWKPAGELVKNDFVGIPIINTNENPLKITKEEAFIIGRYIADGHTRKDYRKSENRPNDRQWQLILSIGISKIERLKESIKDNNFSLYPHGQGTFRAVFSSKRLVEIVEKNCGCDAENKTISKMLLDLPNEILKCLIDGYLSGDGFEFEKDKFSIVTISKNLIMTLGLAIIKVYKVGFSCSSHTPNLKKEICGRLVNQKKQYVLRFSKYTTKQSHFELIDDVCWFPIKSITSTEIKEIVYNMEVDIDNSYTANSFIVHNCQSFSFAGKRKGMSTKCEIEITRLEQYLELKADGFEFEGQSYLFWEYMRILTDIRKYNPNVKFLLENVEMGKKWERILSEAIGLFPVHINSNLVSAQNRKRVYWTNIQIKEVGMFAELHSDIPQPKDRGILLKDILESEVAEKFYLSDKMLNYFDKRAANFNNGKVNVRDEEGKSTTLCASMASCDISDNFIKINTALKPAADQQKAGCLTVAGHSGGLHSDMDLIAQSACIRFGRTDEAKEKRREAMKGGVDYTSFAEREIVGYDFEKMNTLTTVTNKDNLIIVASRGRGEGWKQELEPNYKGKTNTLTSVAKDNLVMTKAYAQLQGGFESDNRFFYEDGKHGSVLTKGIDKTGVIDRNRIRRLTPTECARLQTVPDWYKWNCSDTQQYKMLGNGWTCDVISHIFSFFAK